MQLKDLDFSYPESLVAEEPIRPSRVMLVRNSQATELNWQEFLDQFQMGDALVINNTKVLKRRLFISDLEILFLESQDLLQWQVLMPSKKLKIGDSIQINDQIKLTLIEKGRPQIVKSNLPLTEKFFDEMAELPLPPYIQKKRGLRKTKKEDLSWYQTAWAEKPGSFASPTASLHFSKQDLEYLQQKGVQVISLTLHVGLGTFLPVEVDDLDQHKMHAEMVHIQCDNYQRILEVKKSKNKVWALGTTVTRALESAALNKISKLSNGDFFGETDLLIQPGFQFQLIDNLLTNFHQPKSTLLALVAAFSDLGTVKRCYQWAIEKQFRLFSYGDLSVWIHEK